jgi:hypothetical protein
VIAEHDLIQHKPIFQHHSDGMAFDDDHQPVPIEWPTYGDKAGEGSPEFERESRLLRAVFDFILDPTFQRRGIQRIAYRAIALSWVTLPAYWEGASLAEIARRLNVDPTVIQRHAGAVSRAFGGLRSAGQCHASNWKKEGANPMTSTNKKFLSLDRGKKKTTHPCRNAELHPLIKGFLEGLGRAGPIPPAPEGPDVFERLANRTHNTDPKGGHHARTP